MSGTLLLCLVIGISDGDTIKVRCGEPGAYEQLTIRVSAIDAPEKRQPFGTRSKEALSDLCFKQQATITPRTKDRYGRTVADVQCLGRDAGETQVKAGVAWVYDKYAKGYSHLYPLQSEARAAGRGLWADKDPLQPWEWRRQQKSN